MKNTCQPSTAVCSMQPVAANVTCNDGNACTQSDICNGSGSRVGAPVICDDNLFCNGTETCNPLVGCQNGTAPTLSDGIACTYDQCDEALDKVVHSSNNAACQNGTYCDGEEVCDLSSGCIAGTPINADDGIACTTDYCDEAAKTIRNTPNNAPCQDGAWCNGYEVCKPGIGCQAGPPPTADDGIDCTDPVCDEATDSFTQVVNNSKCNDGNVCTDDVCTIAGCQFSYNTSSCTDGNVCTSGDTCSFGSCIGTPNTVACNDNNPCTQDDQCSGGSCTGTDTGLCSCTTDAQCQQNYGNNNACDGYLTCVAGLCKWEPSTIPVCSSDGNNVCRENQCQSTGATTHVCTFVAINSGATCSDGNPCTINDVCSNAACQGAVKNCGDGQFCNGAETCQVTTGTCLPGTPPNPNDGIACTFDYCDEALNKIVNAPQNQVCDNGLYCDGAETCESGAGGGCKSNPLVLSDGIACTVDSCDEGNDKIDHVPDNTKCDDGKFCNGKEICSATQNCVTINVPNQNDGINCTADSCNETTDKIEHVANNTLCDDNNVCTTDLCILGQGCAHTYHTNPCDDGEACTTGDKCSGGTCVGTAIDPDCSCVPGQTDCKRFYDGNACNGYLECKST